MSALLGIGGASNFNLELGRGKTERAGHIIANAISFSAIGGVTICLVVFSALRPLLVYLGATEDVFPYALSYTSITSYGIPFLVMTNCGSYLIRADGSPRYSMACNLTGALLNTILDPIFIFGFDMGIAGAAWATSISQFIGWLIAIRYLVNYKSVRLKRDWFLPRLSLLRSITSLGAAISVNQLSMMCVQVAMNNTLTHYGALSVYGSNAPLAASGVITKVNMVFMSVIIGLVQGSQPIVGFNYGARNFARVRRTFYLTFGIAAFLSFCAFAVFQIFPREIIRLFGKGTEEYYYFVERYFRIYLFMTFANGIQPVTASLLTSIGKALKGLFISLTRQILFLLPLILLFPILWGIDGVMYAGPAADLAATLVSTALIVSEMRNMRKLELQQSA
jgi:Na+-driven multidrug efflux pump